MRAKTAREVVDEVSRQLTAAVAQYQGTLAHLEQRLADSLIPAPPPAAAANGWTVCADTSAAPAATATASKQLPLEGMAGVAGDSWKTQEATMQEEAAREEEQAARVALARARYASV